jgi:hypothetical protein
VEDCQVNPCTLDVLLFLQQIMTQASDTAYNPRDKTLHIAGPKEEIIRDKLRE